MVLGLQLVGEGIEDRDEGAGCGTAGSQGLGGVDGFGEHRPRRDRRGPHHAAEGVDDGVRVPGVQAATAVVLVDDDPGDVQGGSAEVTAVGVDEVANPDRALEVVVLGPRGRAG